MGQRRGLRAGVLNWQMGGSERVEPGIEDFRAGFNVPYLGRARLRSGQQTFAVGAESSGD